MTISKKLLIVGALALGMQQIALPHTSEVSYHVTTMLNFAQTLRQANHKDALKVAQWLELQACDTSYNVSDCDILAIANVINNDNLTIQSKISVLSQTIATQRNQAIKTTIQRTINDICTAIITVACIGGLTALVGLVIMEEIKNPTPKRPYVTVEYRYQPTWHWDSYYGLRYY
jgi:hypothetical protein